MIGSWNLIAQAAEHEAELAAEKNAQSLPNMRQALSPEQTMGASAPLVPGEQSMGAVQRVQHVTRIIHRHRGGSPKKLNLATALLGHSALAGIVSGAKKGSPTASPPVTRRNEHVLHKFKAKARRIIEVERGKKIDDAAVDQHPRLDYLNIQANDYMRKIEYTKQSLFKVQDKIKRAKKALTVLWKLRRAHQHKKDHERRWTSRDVEHREFDMVTTKQDYSIMVKEQARTKSSVDKARRVNVSKARARGQIQEYIDKLVMQQERHVRKAHEMEALTNVMEGEHAADIRADRQNVLNWEMEYNSLKSECEELERKSLDRRMKETKHLAQTRNGELNVRRLLLSFLVLVLVLSLSLCVCVCVCYLSLFLHI